MKTLRVVVLMWIVVTATAFFGLPSWAGDDVYSDIYFATRLGAFPFTPSDVNESGDVAGTANEPGPAHALILREGALTDLGTLGGRYSYANAINGQGVVVGRSLTNGGVQEEHAFRWAGGIMTDLGTLDGGHSSAAADINEAGQVVGVATTVTSEGRAVLWDGGTVTDLGTLPGGSNSGAAAINNLGIVVGSAEVAGWPRAVVWAGGTPSDLAIGGTFSVATDINDAGQIVGLFGRVEEPHAFLWDGGVVTDLGRLINNFVPVRISGTGVVIGYAVGCGPCVWRRGIQSNLSSITIQNIITCGNNFGAAYATTDAGRILAGGSGNDLWLLTPGCPDSTLDTDGDGLPDCWEGAGGIPIPSGGRYKLPWSCPHRKDIYIEVDALVGRQPSVQALWAVKTALLYYGIVIHIGDEDLPSVDDIDGAPVNWSLWTDFDTFKSSHFGTASERDHPNWPNIKSAKEKAYRYCVFGYTYNSTESSGQARSIPGRDFVVTLGAFGATTANEEAGTFMHELGHTLGLRHAGDQGETFNNKPNYYSVMNHLWQMPVRLNSGCGGASSGPLQRYQNSWSLTYSTGSLPTLNEASLNEAVGIGGDPGKWVPVGPPSAALPFSQIVPMGGPVNWDRVGHATATAVQADVNYIPDCSSSATASPGQTLRDYNDWANLQYAVPTSLQLTALETQQQDEELTLSAFEDLGALQLDCNLNGIADADDIAAGRSQDVDGDGVPDECQAGLVGVGSMTAGVNLTVRQNPAIGRMPIQFGFEIPETGRVSLRIYDTLGAQVGVVLDADLSAGTHTIAWRAVPRGGEKWLGAGVYFAALSVEGKRLATTRLVVMP